MQQAEMLQAQQQQQIAMQQRMRQQQMMMGGGQVMMQTQMQLQQVPVQMPVQPVTQPSPYIVNFVSAKGNLMRFWRSASPGVLGVSENGINYPAFRRIKAGKDPATGEFFVDFEDKVSDGGRPGV
eukprot:gene42781-56629_t